MDFKKMLHKLDMLDIGLIKMSMIAFTLWLVALLPEFADWVQSTSHWLFLAVAVIIAARPLYKCYIKK
ncbi:MAG: hypothetical protein KAR23_04630 [Candidatus Aenigmarchaeota archaeon]|nr:hypothetical protein [Candidatus Aenigmarchaeota archaeon]